MVGFIAFVVVFGVLVFVHELGHFVAARLAKVKVEEFGIGFPPRIAKLGTWQGTEITLNLLPIGGFVRLVEDKPGDPASLASRGRGTRALVHSAGALMNLLLTCLLYGITYMGGTLVPVEEPGAGNTLGPGHTAVGNLCLVNAGAAQSLHTEQDAFQAGRFVGVRAAGHGAAEVMGDGCCLGCKIPGQCFDSPFGDAALLGSPLRGLGYAVFLAEDVIFNLVHDFKAAG